MRTIYSSLRASACLLIAALLLTLGSCSSSDSELLERVPASAGAVVVTNLSRLMDGAGYSADSGTIPQWMAPGASALGSPESVNKAIDLDHIVSFSLPGSGFVAIANLRSDSELATLAANAGMEKADADGYTVWKGSGLSIAVKDNTVWLAPDALAMAKLAASRCASDGKFTLWKGLTEFLSTRSTMGIVVAIDPAGADQQGRYAAIDLEGNQEAASITVCLMKADGEKYTNSSLTTLQTDFLRYLPRNFNAAFAMGVGPDFDWSAVARVVESFGGGQARGFFDVVASILSQCDGTLAIAADAYTLPGNEPLVLAMVHLPQDKVDSVQRDIISQFTTLGVKPILRPDGQTELCIPGMKLFVGNVDGYLAFGTQPFVTDGASPFTTTFEGQLAAAAVQLETLRTYSLSIPYGLDLSAKVGDTDTRVRIAFPGSEARPLANLLSLMAFMF